MKLQNQILQAKNSVDNKRSKNFTFLLEFPTWIHLLDALARFAQLRKGLPPKGVMSQTSEEPRSTNVEAKGVVKNEMANINSEKEELSSRGRREVKLKYLKAFSKRQPHHSDFIDERLVNDPHFDIFFKSSNFFCALEFEHLRKTRTKTIPPNDSNSNE